MLSTIKSCPLPAITGNQTLACEEKVLFHTAFRTTLLSFAKFFCTLAISGFRERLAIRAIRDSINPAGRVEGWRLRRVLALE
jgi:hypothetical protein